MRISDWSSDVCSSDLDDHQHHRRRFRGERRAKVTARFIIVGGIYQERCIQPLWNAVYGSAGRAAHCVSSLVGESVELHAYVAAAVGSEERRDGKECVGTCRSWWAP